MPKHPEAGVESGCAIVGTLCCIDLHQCNPQFIARKDSKICEQEHSAPKHTIRYFSVLRGARQLDTQAPSHSVPSAANG
eukprot:2159930-Amphidinium_carterae.1